MRRRLILAIGLVAEVGLSTNLLWAGSTVPTSSAVPTSPATTSVSGPGEPRQRAKQLYEEGLAAYHAGRHSDAIDKLLEADQVMPNPAFSYNIALVYEAMGDRRSALRWLRGYLRQKGDSSDESATRAKVRKLEAELQARGLQQVTVLSKPIGATLKIDGEASGVTPFTTELVPGSHQITVVLEGFQTAQRLIELRADRSMDVDFALVASAVVGDPVTTAPPVAAAEDVASMARLSKVDTKPTNAGPAAIAVMKGASIPPTVHPIRPLTWISLGVGTALFGGAVYYEFARQSAEDRAARASQATYQERFDAIAPLQTKARVFALAGSVVATTGLVLLTVDLTRHRSVPVASLAYGAEGHLLLSMRGHF